MSFCQKCKILNEPQFGFRSKMSCVQARVTEFLRQRALCFTLEYEILWKIMNTMVSEKKNKELLKSFLSDREQYVSMNDLETEIFSIKTRVPQGSVLGPFLFLKYINDLHDVSDKAEITMFANDTTLIKSGTGTQCLFSSEKRTICDWFL